MGLSLLGIRGEGEELRGEEMGGDKEGERERWGSRKEVVIIIYKGSWRVTRK